MRRAISDYKKGRRNSEAKGIKAKRGLTVCQLQRSRHSTRNPPGILYEWNNVRRSIALQVEHNFLLVNQMDNSLRNWNVTMEQKG
jgi:hypothetical protein